MQQYCRVIHLFLRLWHRRKWHLLSRLVSNTCILYVRGSITWIHDILILRSDWVSNTFLNFSGCICIMLITCRKIKIEYTWEEESEIKLYMFSIPWETMTALRWIGAITARICFISGAARVPVANYNSTKTIRLLALDFYEMRVYLGCALITSTHRNLELVI